MRIARIVQDIAAAYEDKPRCEDFLLHDLRIDAVQLLRIARARAGFGGVVQHDEGSTRLQQIEHRLVDLRDGIVRHVVKVVVVA